MGTRPGKARFLGEHLEGCDWAIYLPTNSKACRKRLLTSPPVPRAIRAAFLAASPTPVDAMRNVTSKTLIVIFLFLCLNNARASLWDDVSLESVRDGTVSDMVSTATRMVSEMRTTAGVQDVNAPATVAEAAEMLTTLRLFRIDEGRALRRTTCNLITPLDDGHHETPCDEDVSYDTGRPKRRMSKTDQKKHDLSAEEILKALNYKCSCDCSASVRQEGSVLVERMREQRWAKDGGTGWAARMLAQAVETYTTSTLSHAQELLKLTGNIVVSVGVKVCVPVFFRLTGIRHNMQVQLRKAVLAPDRAYASIWNPKMVMDVRKQKEAIIKRSILSWIETYVHTVGDYQPTKDEIHLDPEGNYYTWVKYQSSVIDSPWLKTSHSYFRNVWNWRAKEYPYFSIRAKKDTSSPCADCIQYHLNLKQALDTGTAGDVATAHKYINAHYLRVEKNKKLYWNRLEKGRLFEQHISVVGDIMDQKKTSLPHFADFKINQALSGFSEVKAFLSIKLYGFLVHGDKWLAALAPPWTKKSGSLTVTVLMQALNNVKHRMPFPKVLHWQVDGGSENWNNIVFAWASYLVQQKVFEKIVIHRLHVGHTHCDADQLYSVIRRKLMGFGKCPHGTGGRTPDEWTRAVASAFVKQAGAPTIQWLNDVFDIVTFFDGHLDKSITGYGASIETCEIAPGVVREDITRRSHLLVAEVFTPETSSHSGETPLPMIRFKADDLPEEDERWYPTEMYNGVTTHADGKKPIGVRFLTSIPPGRPTILKYKPDEWQDLEDFKQSLEAIKRRVPHAVPEDFICTWQAWLQNPPGETIKLHPTLPSLDSDSPDEQADDDDEQDQETEEERNIEPYGAPRLMYDPLTHPGRSQAQKNALRKEIRGGAPAGIGQNDDVFSMEFDELEVGDMVIALASPDDLKALKWTLHLHNGRLTSELVMVRVKALYPLTKMVDWEYWKRKSSKSDLFIPALHAKPKKATKAKDMPIEVTSKFDADELILTISLDPGDITHEGFLLRCQQKHDAQAALQKYLNDQRLTNVPGTRTADIRRGSSSANPQPDSDDPRTKRTAEDSPKTPGGSRSARDHRMRGTKAKRAIINDD